MSTSPFTCGGRDKDLLLDLRALDWTSEAIQAFEIFAAMYPDSVLEGVEMQQPEPGIHMMIAVPVVDGEAQWGDPFMVDTLKALGWSREAVRMYQKNDDGVYVTDDSVPPDFYVWSIAVEVPSDEGGGTPKKLPLLKDRKPTLAARKESPIQEAFI